MCGASLALAVMCGTPPTPFSGTRKLMPLFVVHLWKLCGALCKTSKYNTIRYNPPSATVFLRGRVQSFKIFIMTITFVLNCCCKLFLERHFSNISISKFHALIVSINKVNSAFTSHDVGSSLPDCFTWIAHLTIACDTNCNIYRKFYCQDAIMVVFIYFFYSLFFLDRPPVVPSAASFRFICRSVM